MTGCWVKARLIGAIVNVKDLLACRPMLSVTVYVRVAVVAATGVPVIWPVEEFRLKPVGRLPPLKLQVLAPVPLAASSVTL